jgi:RimJ/RimL family protein N-acetyltransferase
LTPEIRTARLLLRGWRAEDREPFAEMSADPQAMLHYPSPLTRRESHARVDHYEAEWARSGFGKWAVEIPGVAPFAGSVGLGTLAFTASFTPCIEIGWRLARPCWGHGYATEAARAALEFGFRQLRLPAIVAFTIPANTRSVRVMEKLSMRFSGEFAHPLFPDGHRLRRHVLYLAVPQYYA